MSAQLWSHSLVHYVNGDVLYSVRIFVVVFLSMDVRRKYSLV